MAYWLLKSEPDVYAWEQLVNDGHGSWDGVRNYQARNNLRAMKVGDFGFFYHSNIDRAVVGIVRIIREHYPDPTDPTGRFSVVDVEPVRSLKVPVTLAQIKGDPRLKSMALVRHSRLSVSQVTKEEWEIILGMG